MIANTAVYRNGTKLHVDAKPDDLTAVRAAVKAGQPGDFVSVGLHEPDADEMGRVADVFGIHRLAVEDAVHPVQRPKLDKYGDMVFLVLRTLSHDKGSDTLGRGQIAVFLGPDYVVTVRQDTGFELEPVRHDLESHVEVLKQGPAAVVYAVCDRVVDSYSDLVDAFEDAVDDVESTVFAPERVRSSKRIYELKRELTTMRRAVVPLQAPMQKFAQAEITGVSEAAAPFFRDVADHLVRVSDEIDALDNLLSNAFDAHLSRVGVQQNDDMRRMSAWAAIAAAVTVLAGIYGMNFAHMPELSWTFGYAWGMSLMAIAAVVLHRKFKRSGWL